MFLAGISSKSITMADSAQTPTNSSNGIGTHSRTIILNDWWLVKSQNHFQGHHLAVSGISSRKEEAGQIFVSAPIIKRFDVFSLETADGIYVYTRGFINEQRTLENGFTPQILKSFLYGFPPNWESYALECITEESEVGIDSANAVPANVSTISQEILSDAVEKSFPTSFVSPEKATGDIKKSLLEDEHDKSIKMSEVNVHGSGENRRSVRLHNIKLSQKKQAVTEGPPKYPNEHQISASAALEKSDGGQESPSTPVQSQLKGPVNALSEQVKNKFASRVSKTTPAKTEGCYKKKRVTIIKSASSVEYSQERDVSHLNKGSKQRLSAVSPNSLSLKMSRSGRLLLPPLEFWRNQIPIYNADHEITEIQEGSSLISPFRGSSPSLGRYAENMRGGKMILLRTNEHQSSASAALEKSDGGQESLSTLVQSQLTGPVNALSEQVTNKFASRVSKTSPAKTEGCYKKKRVTIIQSASSVEYSQEMDPKKNETAVPQAPQASNVTNGTNNASNAHAATQDASNVTAATQQGPIDDDAEFEMLAAEHAAAFEATQPQPTVLTNGTQNANAPGVGASASSKPVKPVKPKNKTTKKLGTEAGASASQPAATAKKLGTEASASASQPVPETGVSATLNEQSVGGSALIKPLKPKKKTIQKVGSEASASDVNASATATPAILKPKKITKKKVARKLDVKDLRRSDRTRTLRCNNIKGPGSDPSQPITIEDEDSEANEEGQHVGTSSQSNLNDPKVGGCLGALRGCDAICRRLTQ